MDRKEIVEKVNSIFASVLEKPHLNVDENELVTNIEGWTSLINLIIVNEVEKTFSVKFKLRELGRMDTINSIVDLIALKIVS